MKTLIRSFALMICFSFISSSVINAQVGIRNFTDCTYTASVEYGDPCDGVDEINNIVVLPNSTTPVSIPSPYSTVLVKIGHSDGPFTGCVLEISDCPGWNTSEPIKCGDCEGAVATLFSNGSVIIQ